MSLLEQLASGWFEYTGYFVRTNVRARKRAAGGGDAELDVLAYQPSSRTLLRIETLGEAESWGERKHGFLTKKFVFSRAEYEGILGSQKDSIHRKAIVGWSQSPKTDLNWGEDIEVIAVPTFLSQIVSEPRNRDFMSEAVPESYPILRTIQMTLKYGVQAANPRCT